MGRADDKLTVGGPGNSGAGKTPVNKRNVKGVIDAAQQALPGIAEAIALRREERAAKEDAKKAREAEIRTKEQSDAREKAEKLALARKEARKKAKEDEEIRKGRELLEEQQREEKLKEQIRKELQKEYQAKAAAVRKSSPVAFNGWIKPEESDRVRDGLYAMQHPEKAALAAKAQKTPGLTNAGWDPDEYLRANPMAKGGGYAQGGAPYQGGDVHFTNPTPHHDPRSAGPAIGAAQSDLSTHDPQPKKHKRIKIDKAARALFTGEARHKTKVKSPWVTSEIKVGEVREEIKKGVLPTGEEDTEAHSMAIGNSAKKPKMPGYLPTPSPAREGYVSLVSWANRSLGREERTYHSQPHTAMDLSDEAGPAMDFSDEYADVRRYESLYHALPPEQEEVQAATLLTGMMHNTSSAPTAQPQPSTQPQPGPADQPWPTKKGKGPAQNL
mgnify:CR=1 FL=1